MATPEQAKAIFEGAKEVAFPMEGDPDTATSVKLGAILTRIYGDDADGRRLKSEWLCRELGVTSAPKGQTARGIFDTRDLETRCRIIQAAADYEAASRPAGWMEDGAPPANDDEALADQVKELSK